MPQLTALTPATSFKAGQFLNEQLRKYGEMDYTQCDCYSYEEDGEITLAWAFFNWVKLPTGWCAEASIASKNHKFNKKHFKELLALFFKNIEYNRLYALIAIDNKQAVRCVELMGFQLEGRLRNIAKDGDRFIYSIIRADYERTYLRCNRNI